MKTLVVANQKGGVGKTSTLVHIAFDFAERGIRVAVLDLDSQGNSSDTLSEFKCGVVASQLFSANGAEAIAKAGPFTDADSKLILVGSDNQLLDNDKRDLNELIQNMRNSVAALDAAGIEVLLIDTAPSLNANLTVALATSGYVLMPIELERYSIIGVQRMQKTIDNVRKVNPSLQNIGILASKVDARNPRHVTHLAQLQGVLGARLLPFTIGLRSSIADALASKKPVWKIQKTTARKAAQEVRDVAGHMIAKMEIAE